MRQQRQQVLVGAAASYAYREIRNIYVSAGKVELHASSSISLTLRLESSGWVGGYK